MYNFNIMGPKPRCYTNLRILCLMLGQIPCNNILCGLKLPSLPMEFWSVQAIIVNGDLLGKIILVDDCLMSDHRSVARVLIDLDVHGGLYESLDLVIGDNVYSHLLDYQHMPFRCTRCHVYG